jgi:catechol 2,3-dioxygenase-like lactoylglutathione lyase family enzyme
MRTLACHSRIQLKGGVYAAIPFPVAISGTLFAGRLSNWMIETAIRNRKPERATASTVNGAQLSDVAPNGMAGLVGRLLYFVVNIGGTLAPVVVGGSGYNSLTMKLRLLLGFALICAISAPAQLLAPNSDGVAMGHVHLTVRDLDANRKFFAALGGVPVANGSLQMIGFPGMYVILEKGEPSAGSVGSTINHFGFNVKSMKEWIPKWQAAGLRMEPMSRPTQQYLLTPDDVRVEILEEPALATPVAGHHLHFATQDIPGMQAWYAKTFGGIPGKRAQFETDDLPGINLSFSAINTAPVATKGRALDHIGFEVKNLPAFLSKLQAAGIKIDRPLAKIPNSSVSAAFFTDPWGTYIELTEGLAGTNK